MPTTKLIKPEEYLFVEGEPSRSIFIVKRGALSIRKAKIGTNTPSTTGLNYIELVKVAAGEVIGELSFFDRKARSASAIALIETELIELTFTELDKLYQEIPPYLRTIIEALAARLRSANDQIRLLQKRIEQASS